MGWRDCMTRISCNIRTLSLGRGEKDENVQFVKFSHSESERELHVIQNGSVQTNMRNSTSGWTSDGDEWDNFRYVDEVSDRDNTGDPRERISEWQAGWNVTNAIQ
ncbi:hypothetical protein BaRGS_00016789, partial [Batillaria attramentaria]